MSVLPFRFASKIPGLKAFSSLRGHNLGLNTDEAAGEVVRQRQELWAEQGIPLEQSIFMKQVHADRMEAVGAAQAGRGSLSLDDAIPDCDAMIATAPGLFLCVGHADCLAVLLVDPRQRKVGVAHSGWRGAALSITAKLAAAMVAQQGSRPEELWAGLSFCLGPCHLELSQDQHAIFAQQEGHEAFCSELKDGHFKLDLWSHAKGQLLKAGLDPARIEIQDQCTACHPELFYSYRRAQGHCGRMMSVVGFG